MKLGRVARCCLLAVCGLGVAHAQNMRKTAEASMVVTGTVEVNPDGTLHGYAIDQQDKVPADVVAVINNDIPHWLFKLSSPATKVVNTKISILMVNKPVGDGNYTIAVSGASLDENPDVTGESVSRKGDGPLPIYPEVALNARVTGTVFVLLRVSRDGTVDNAAAEQTNLDQYGSQSQMNQLRKLFAEAALKAARQWTFNLPTRGRAMDDPYWQIRVPVNFYLYGKGRSKELPAYGTWRVYIPGPRQTPSWVSQALLSEAPDAMQGTGPHTGSPVLQLATPLGGT